MQLECCVCQTSKYEKQFKVIDDFVLMNCFNCGLIYLKNPPSSPQDFIDSAHKAQVEYWSFPDLYYKHLKVFERYFRERLGRLRRFKRDIRNMLDIGSGYGFWMRYCEQNNISAYGLDLSREAAQFARDEFGLKVETVSFDGYQNERQFDSIVMCDVLEHLLDPNSALQKCKSLLMRGGLLYIQVPNILGFKLPVGQGYQVPHHLWHFRLESLKSLLERNDFEVLADFTGIMGVVGVYEKGGPDFKKRLIWQLARNFKIGNRLQIIAKVKEK